MVSGCNLNDKSFVGIYYCLELFVNGMEIRELAFARFTGGIGNLENL